MAWIGRKEQVELDQDLPPFRPEAADSAAFRAELMALIDKLLPAAVDEATPHVLDKMIDKHTLVRVARLTRQLAEYQENLMPYLIDARAELAYEEVVHEAEQRNLAELRAARDAAVRKLSGSDLPGGPPSPHAIAES